MTASAKVTYGPFSKSCNFEIDKAQDNTGVMAEQQREVSSDGETEINKLPLHKVSKKRKGIRPLSARVNHSKIYKELKANDKSKKKDSLTRSKKTSKKKQKKQEKKGKLKHALKKKNSKKKNRKDSGAKKKRKKSAVKKSKMKGGVPKDILSELPIEIKRRILAMVGFSSVVHRMTLLNKTWQNICVNDNLLWKLFFRYHYPSDQSTDSISRLLRIWQPGIPAQIIDDKLANLVDDDKRWWNRFKKRQTKQQKSLQEKLWLDWEHIKSSGLVQFSNDGGRLTACSIEAAIVYITDPALPTDPSFLRLFFTIVRPVAIEVKRLINYLLIRVQIPKSRVSDKTKLLDKMFKIIRFWLAGYSKEIFTEQNSMWNWLQKTGLIASQFESEELQQVYSRLLFSFRNQEIKLDKLKKHPILLAALSPSNGSDLAKTARVRKIRSSRHHASVFERPKKLVVDETIVITKRTHDRGKSASVGLEICHTRLPAKYERKRKRRKGSLLKLKTSFAISSLDEVSVKGMAEVIAMHEWKLFSKVESKEFLGQSWMTEELKFNAPNILLNIRHFSVLVSWVSMRIVSIRHTKLRTKLVARFIRLAMRLLELNCLSGVMAILTALNSTPVFRLRQTLGGLSKKERISLEELKELMSPTQSYKNYRELLKSVKPPLVPYLGIHLRDLASMMTGNPHTVQKGLINWEGYRLIYETISQLHSYQQIRYPFPEDNRIAEFLTNQWKRIAEQSEDEMDNEISRLSYKCEPTKS